MAKERGWWSINFTVEPNESDLEHIAHLVKEGFTSGEICEDDIEEIKESLTKY